MTFKTPAAAPQPAERHLIRAMMIAGAALALLAFGLWAKFGSAVFLDTMAAAWAYCF